MASDPFFNALIARRTIYGISDASPIPDSRITEIVTKAIQHTPSSFNVQSARVVVLLKDEHKKFWDLAGQVAKESLPEAVSQSLAPRIEKFRGGYGSVLFFESEADLTALAAKHAAAAPFVTEWSDTSSGMHQLAVWTALSAEGLGASLQHYNFLPPLTDKVKEDYKLPSDWKLKAQLVFGTPVGGALDKTSKPLEDRVKVFGQ